MTTFEFTVVGVAEPAGSKTAYVRGGRAIVVDANKRAAPWKEVVAGVAAGHLLAARVKPPLFAAHVPLTVEITVVKTRPKSHLGKTGLTAAGRLQSEPTSRPDVLKYARAIEDAMTTIVYEDDAQIVCEHLVKRWGPRDEVLVTVIGGE